MAGSSFRHVERRHLILCLLGRAEGSFRCSLESSIVAGQKHREYAIAEEFQDLATGRLHRRAQAIEDTVQAADHFFRRALIGETGEAAQIGIEDRGRDAADIAALIWPALTRRAASLPI